MWMLILFTFSVGFRTCLVSKVYTYYLLNSMNHMNDVFYNRLSAENRRLGLLFGLAVGFGFVAALWLPDAWMMYQATVEGAWISLIAGLLLCLPLALLAGWLAGTSQNGLLGALIWAGAAAAMSWIAGHIPYEVQSWWTALKEPALRGLEIYP